MVHLVFQGVLLGIGATLLLDVWSAALGMLPGQSAPNWALVGRWFWRLREGRVFHDDIAKAEPWAHELALGWAGHYAVGVVYGVAFALIVGPGWMAAPSFLPAWIFGIVTLAAGWFLLQPGMGLGWAASRTPNPGMRRLIGLAGHTVFGLGLYATALLIG
ncbi:DUF2938 domain-containing protein [Amaricoccus sp.]|uniref:DUF2938 domain-containing protein n=1 Tax=Amaricoccus sp. TaxID=1872485 RepID=UPI001B44B41F|nr:DUF2938 domain-containing protein [Amaricoccus sp.]MBP7001345.1 DUF2938 domain-containing protein [Amaricoccus sp.]